MTAVVETAPAVRPASAALAQSIVDDHYAIATSDDPAISDASSAMYQASRRLVTMALRQVYGLSRYHARRVYDTWIETGEPVAWCVAYVAAHPTSRYYSE